MSPNLSFIGLRNPMEAGDLKNAQNAAGNAPKPINFSMAPTVVKSRPIGAFCPIWQSCKS